MAQCTDVTSRRILSYTLSRLWCEKLHAVFWGVIRCSQLFDPILYMLANFLWTTLPVIVYSFSEQDLPEHLLPSIPVLYTLVRRFCSLVRVLGTHRSYLLCVLLCCKAHWASVVLALVVSCVEKKERLFESVSLVQGRRRLYFNGFTFSFWIVEGIIYALITYYLLHVSTE